MAKRPGIFPTFFLSGFECSTFRWKDKRRRNLVRETKHDEHVHEDYQLLRQLGIAVAREGVPWPFVDRAGKYDFSCIDPMIDAMNQAQVIPIWSLCQYGYPDDLDPFTDEFTDRFTRYCRAVAEYVIKRVHGPYFFTPFNEITFFAFAGGEMGWIAPYKNTREDRFKLREVLCKAAIAGIKAIRAVEPKARIINNDPLVQIVAPRDRPDLKKAAEEETYVDTFRAWDILCGKELPELGGGPDILDIVGPNNYSFGQMEYRENAPHVALPPGDDRIKPLGELLSLVWKRYQRPMIIAETSGLGKGRDEWLDDVMEESLAAVNDGMDLHGICLFPLVDMPDWHNGKWLHNGICDLVEEDGDLKRVPDKAYIDTLRKWQKELNRVTVLDEDPFSDPVELQDVIEAAKRLKKTSDVDWS
ncbi:MAG TPA: family 1 glycosylhydrolase [Pyrinomonadaceae bacterium]